MNKKTSDDLRRQFARAVSTGQHEVVRTMLGEGLNPNTVDEHENPVLYTAAFMGDTEILRILLGAGANVNYRSYGTVSPSNSRSALNVAASQGHWECVELLLDHGANPSIVDSHHRTAGHILLTWLDRSEKYVSNPAELEKLFLKMIDAGLPISQVDDDGASMLHLAVESKAFPSTIEMLLDCGANPLMTDDHGMTPLHRAAADGLIAPLRTLVQCGVDINTRNRRGQTVLHQVTNHEVQKVVLGMAPDLEARDHYGWTPLAARLRGFRPETIQLLGVPELVMQLLEAGAKADTPDLSGVTPRDYIAHHSLDPVAAVVSSLDARRAIQRIAAMSQATRPTLP